MEDIKGVKYSLSSLPVEGRSAFATGEQFKKIVDRTVRAVFSFDGKSARTKKARRVYLVIRDGAEELILQVSNPITFALPADVIVGKDGTAKQAVQVGADAEEEEGE